MLEQIPTLKPVSSRIVPCKICGDTSPLLGVVDFNKSCEEQKSRFLPLSGIAIYYRRCTSCGFVFTDAFDNWTVGEFQRHIYNESYVSVDPDYREMRPKNNAKLVAHLFPPHTSELSLLDYGGGNGILASTLREQLSYKHVVTYDPFVPAFSELPQDRFDIVTSFETLEHSPDPNQTVAEMAKLVKENGIILFSTLVIPEKQCTRNDLIGWWYIGPRNGHVSIFSRQALALIWKRVGFQCASFNDDLHVAFKAVPQWAQHLVRPRR